MLTLISLARTAKIVDIDTTALLWTTDEKFLSVSSILSQSTHEPNVMSLLNYATQVAIDTHVVAEHWKHFSFTSRRVQNLAKGIQPAYLRLGGTAADLARFEPYPARQHSLRSRLGGKIAPEVPAAAINRDKINVTDCFSVEENTDQVVSFRRKMNYTIESHLFAFQVCEDLESLYKKKNFTISGKDWIKINEFVGKVGWKFLFDFNVLLRCDSKEYAW